MTVTAPMSRWQRLLDPSAPRATILVRIAVGIVFASEGIQKFLYADALGAGRFEKIGIPAPELMGSIASSTGFPLVHITTSGSAHRRRDVSDRRPHRESAARYSSSTSSMTPHASALPGLPFLFSCNSST